MTLPGAPDRDDPLQVRLDVFEGPLDLLLYLIQRAEIDILAIPLERLARDYVDYLDRVPAIDLAEAGEFLVMAATLVHLKSRSLLPPDLLEDGEEEPLDDPRWDLVRQLIEYKKFKQAAVSLAGREDAWADWFPHHLSPPEKPVREPAGWSGEASPAELLAAFEEVLQRAGRRDRGRSIEDERWTVAEKIEHVLTRIRPGSRLSFSALFAPAASRTEIIVTFLALLELLKTHRLRAAQSVPLGDIELHRDGMA